MGTILNFPHFYSGQIWSLAVVNTAYLGRFCSNSAKDFEISAKILKRNVSNFQLGILSVSELN